MREVYLHPSDTKIEDSAITFSTYNHFIQEFHSAEKSKQPILIHMKTIGGDWECGMGIYDAISFSPCKVDIIGHGCLYSMGSILLQAAKRRLLMPNCNFMIHLGTAEVSGEHTTVSSTMEYYNQLIERMIDIYSERCCKGEYFVSKGMDQKKIKEFIYKKLKDKSDWYMPPEEAVYYGFADQVLNKRTYNYARHITKRNTKKT